MVSQIHDALPYDVIGATCNSVFQIVTGILCHPDYLIALFFYLAVMLGLSVLIIALFLLITKHVFLILQELKSRSLELIIIFGLLWITIIQFLIPVIQSFFFTDISESAGSSGFALLMLLWAFFIWNFWWVMAAILPSYFMYPEIRQEKRWKDVVACFIFLLGMRCILEWILVISPLKAYSVFAEGTTYVQPYFKLGYIVLILAMTGLAFFGYWIIHTLKQRVPLVTRWLAVE